ncbi:MAG: class I SAM-dependent methyltransferase [Candidatus Aminicenantes bacterium]|nr:class I SAM-dependent methyltransferase [Candidatus Aminicenantes bacterium]
MEKSAVAVEARVEEFHWWFRGRRKLLSEMIQNLPVSLKSPVLDVGTSTGTNLRLLRGLGFGNFIGTDIHDDALAFCAEKGFGQVKKGDVCRLPFEDKMFKLVLATDILEHVENEALALTEINRVLSPEGYVVLTVPAFRFLWGIQDDVSHHKKRYTKRELISAVEVAGLRCLESFYFNYIFFLPIFFARRTLKVLRIRLKSENQINCPLINSFFTGVFSFDVRTSKRFKPPIGVSILVLAQKKG